MYLCGWDFETRHPRGAAKEIRNMAQSQPLFDAVYNGDCLDVMVDWPDAFVDLCYVELPFGARWRWVEAAMERVNAIQRALDHPAHDVILGLHIALGDVPMVAYLSYMAERLVPIKRVLKPTGSVYLCCPPPASHTIKIVLDAVFGEPDPGSEFAWCGSEIDESSLYDTVFRYALGKDRAFEKSEKEALVKLASSATSRPALAERIVATASQPGDVVLDPFRGCGATLDAAKRLNRRWIGIQGVVS